MGYFGVVQNLRGGGLTAQAGNHLVVAADLSATAWKSLASHEVFTVTGAVRMRMWIICTETLEDAGNAAIIQFGHDGATNAFIGATDAAGRNGQIITAGQLWYDTSPAAGPEVTTTAVLDYIIPNGQDVGYEITEAALTNGTLDFHCVWEPLDTSGNVVAGDGGSLT